MSGSGLPRRPDRKLREDSKIWITDDVSRASTSSRDMITTTGWPSKGIGSLMTLLLCRAPQRKCPPAVGASGEAHASERGEDGGDLRRDAAALFESGRQRG